MVCKEDVFSWFKEAASYRRIDIMCQLLNMCLPFELRYLGSCVEEQGKHDYQLLRGPALVANNPEKLAKDICISKGVFDKCARARLIVLMSVLHSRSHNCANLIYNALLRTEGLESYLSTSNCNKDKDKDLHDDLLLLFLMANNHPAFTYEQKRYFSETYRRLNESENQVQPTHMLPPYPPGLGYIKPPIPIHMTVGVAKVPSSSLPLAEAPMPPPGIPVPAAVHGDFVPPPALWSRTPFPAPPPDLSTFPPQMSPLVSQQSSPTPSRSVSPTRMFPCRSHPPPMPPMPPMHIERLPPPPPPLKDNLVLTTPHYSADLKSVCLDEIHTEGNDKSSQHQWMESPIVISSKLPNGLLASLPLPPPAAAAATPKCPGMYLSNEMATLSLESEASVQCTSCSSSSSDSHSPPVTPTDLPVPPQGPGRGEPHAQHSHSKPRTSNTSSVPPPGLPTPELFTNTCTVPYSSHYPVPPPAPTTTFPNRSLFYSQTYRPPFPAYQQNGEITYMYSYVPVMNFSAPPPPKMTCYNCGLGGHMGSECKEPTIEEITQKKGFQIDYTTPPPDSQPPADKQ